MHSSIGTIICVRYLIRPRENTSTRQDSCRYLGAINEQSSNKIAQRDLFVVVVAVAVVVICSAHDHNKSLNKARR